MKVIPGRKHGPGQSERVLRQLGSLSLDGGTADATDLTLLRAPGPLP
jgi:hypothetical protein